MKRKEFFNVGLYLEGLRRLRLPGIIFFVILALESVLFPLIYVVEEYSHRVSMELEMGSYVPTPMSTSVLEVHPLLAVSFCIIVPVLTWTAFSFLNKRSSSDFYHSLPHTRLSLYVSTLSALITWVLALILIPSGISRLFVSFFPNVFSVVPGSYWAVMLGCIAASAFVMGVIVCAMCITGTVFTNIIVAGLLMFFPRYVAIFMTTGVANAFPLIPVAYVSKILSSDINIITGIVMDGLFLYGEFECLTSLLSQIYTLSVGILYLAVGAVLFYRRKSESADRSAPSPFMQGVYRIAITMCICTPLCYVLFVESNNFSAEEYFLLFLLYLVAALVYFIYELITTRKWKNLLKALPGLGIVALLNVALVVSMWAITVSERGFAPEADEITYIQIVDEDPHDNSYMSFFEYARNEASKVKITDPKALDIVSRSLRSSIDYVNDHGFLGNVYYEGKGMTAQIYTFKIKTATNTEYRKVRVKESDFNVIAEALSSSEEYADSWLLLPEAQRGTVYVDVANYVSLKQDDAYEMFAILKDEVKNLDFNEWYTFLSGDNYDLLGQLNYTSNGVKINLPLSSKLMPKTAEFILEKLAEFIDENEPQADFRELLKKDSVQVGSIMLHYMDDQGEYRRTYLNEYMLRENDELDLISECIEDGEIKLGDNFMVINLWEVLESKEDSDGLVYYEETASYTAVLRMSDDVREVLADYLPEDVEYYKYVD